MKAVTSIEFTTELVLERSSISTLQSLGIHKCSMELYTEDGTVQRDDVGTIEWIMGIDTPEEDVAAHIGVWWDEKKRLTSYDGVFSLPKEAVKLLRKAGVIVPNEFK